MRLKLIPIFISCVCLLSCASTPKEPPVVEGFFMDHTYTVTENADDYKSVLARGFVATDRMVRHPGPLECRFIIFSWSEYPFRQYLEWAHATDFVGMMKMYKKSGDEFARNGLAFKSQVNLEQHYERIKRDLGAFGVSLDHKNFDWEKNNKDHLPGWDFVSIKKPIVKDLANFGIQYGKRPEPAALTDHPNSAEGIMGVILRLTPQEYENMKKLAGQEVSPGVIQNHENFLIFNANQFPELKKQFKYKSSTHMAVILKIKDEKKFQEFAKPDYDFEFHKLKFMGLKTPNASWDIIATTSGKLL